MFGTAACMWGDLPYRYLSSGLTHFLAPVGDARASRLQVPASGSNVCHKQVFLYIEYNKCKDPCCALTSRKDNMFIPDRMNVNALYDLITIYGMY